MERKHVFDGYGYIRVRPADQPDTGPFLAMDRAAREAVKHRVVPVPAQWHDDGRGGLVELYRERVYGPVRQAYISETLPGVVKGWHLHETQYDRFVCIRGRVLVATCPLPYDAGDVATLRTRGWNTEVKETILDPSHGLAVLEIPPYTAHGWIALGNEPAWVLNLCSEEYDGRDEYRIDPHGGPVPGLISYDWRRRRDG